MWKMIVVDDDKFEREGIEFLVKKYNLKLELIEADSGESALHYIASQQIDILFTDIRMKGMDGLELAEKARKISKTLKVVFMSAYSDFEYAQRAIDVSAIRYILKPVKINEFLKIMSQVIQLCEEEQHNRNHQERMEGAYRRELRHEKRRKVTDLIYDKSEAEGGFSDIAASIIPEKDIVSFRLIMLDSRQRLFDLIDLELERDLKEIIGTDFEFIDLNEFQSLLFVSEKTKHREDKEDLMRLGEKIIKWFREFHHTEMTVVIGELLDQKQSFGQQFSELEAVLENKFFYDHGTVLFSDLTSLADERKKETIDDAFIEVIQEIKRGHYDIARVHLTYLIEIMQNNDRFTVTYVKYLCTEIAKTIFDVTLKKDPVGFQKNLEMIYKTTNLIELRMIILEIMESSEPFNNNQTESNRKAIEDVVHIIETEYSLDLSLDLLAERLYLTPSYLSHLFKRFKGISIIKYLTMHRMRQASHLLLTTNQKITQISRSVGYTNIPYFSSLFKAHYGKTPTQYREDPTS